MSGRGEFRVNAENTGWEGHGGYMLAKARKLEEQFDQDAVSKTQSSAIFQGVAIYVNGWTDPSHDELKVIMAKNGGKYHMYYSRRKTTHVIASNLPHAKRKELQPGQKIVKPQWITDSLKAKQLLPIDDYFVVPVEEGAQNRITSMFEKNRSSVSSILDEPSASVIQKNHNTKNDCQNSNSSANTSHTICSTADSNFLSEFYAHSRLHFLSTWKMELKEYVRSLQSTESLERIPLSGYKDLLDFAKSEVTCQDNAYGRSIMHIDMDCFFVSVGLKSHPELKGLPVAVTHSSGEGTSSDRPKSDFEYERNYYQKKYGDSSKISDFSSSSRTSYNPSIFGPGFSASEIASCSYEARSAGVKNGMFMGKAKQLCPDLRVIPYDFEAYRHTSDLLYDTVASFTRHIEAVSCDEALVDITKLVRETRLSPIQIAARIRAAVKEATGCNASAGVGPNIALARMATKRAKPDGEFMVLQDEAKEFMKNLPVKDLPGVGRSTAHRLQEMGVSDCGHLQKFPLPTLKNEFGAKTGQKLHDMSCGVDCREVEVEKERKSVSAEVNYGIRLGNDEEAKTFLRNLSREVVNRLKAIEMRGRKVTLKIMVRRSDAPQESVKYGGHGICDSLSKTSLITLKNKGDVYEEDSSAIYECAWSILSSMHLKVVDLRGIGIQVTHLQPLADVKESASATFLKKFMTKKATNKPHDASADIEQASTSEEAASNIQDPAISEPSEYLDESFLEALPPDLRKEVAENMTQQRQALEQNFLQNENSNDSHASSVIYIDESSRGSTSSANLFYETGKSSNFTKKNTKKTKKTKVSKSKASKAGSSKSTKRTRVTEASPNKLITDMFPVTYSPRKSIISPGKQLTIPSSRKSSTSAPVEKARKQILSTTERDVPEPIPECTNRNAEHSRIPSLGGAFEIREIRQALGEWIGNYTAEGPLDCDVEDFISFLIKTAVELRDLEKVHLTLCSFRRALLKLPAGNVSTDIWRNVYTRVCDELQVAIRSSYHGAKLAVLSL